MRWTCPDDLADALRDLMTDITFELRALRDVARTMTRPEDELALAKTRATCVALHELGRHLLPLTTLDDAIAFCCVLEWHWNHERPRFCSSLDHGAIAFAIMTIDDYDAHWRRLAPLAKRELARYPRLLERAG